MEIVRVCTIIIAVCCSAYAPGLSALDLLATRFDVLSRIGPCSGPWPTSPHPYSSFLNVSWTNKCAGAEALEITFDPQTRFESGFDFLHVTDASGAEASGSPFTGETLAGKTVWVRGDTVVLRLETDSAVSDWGFKVSSIIALGRDPNPAAVARGGLTLLWEVENRGADTTTTPWFGSAYVSTNPTLSSDAILVGSDLVTASLLPNERYSQISNFGAPNLRAGDYFLIFHAEDGSSPNTSNGELAIPLRIENVDLGALSLKAPASAAPQQPISVTWTVTNAASRAALPDWYDHLYVRQGQSSNFVNRAWQNAIVPGGGTYTVQQSVNLPTLASGTYNLELAVNASDLAETNLDNNLLSVPILIVAPDLVGVSAVIEQGVIAGEWFSAALTVSNISAATAYGPWYDLVYLSPTNFRTPEAILVGRAVQYDPVSPFSTYVQYFDLNLSAEFTGDWFLIFVTDAAGNLADPNMQDNVVAVPFRLKAADLEPTIFRATIGTSTNLIASPQQSININWRVRNRGEVVAKHGWTDSILLATDPGGTNAVALLASVWRFSELEPLEDYGRSTIARAPPVAPGDYFLVFHTDRENYQAESDDLNNISSIPIRIIDADLAVQSLMTPSTVAPEQSFNVLWTVRNLGTGTAYPPWEDILYLANTNDPGVALEFLAQRSSSAALAANSAYNATQAVKISSLPAGAYTLVLETHYSLYSPEFRANDRTSAMIRLQGPDLLGLAVIGPSAACLHSNMQVNFFVSNAGPGTVAGPLEVQFYLSPTPTWSPDATLLGSATSPVLLPAGGTASIPAQVYLSGHVAGSYFLIGRADSIRYADPNASNNTASKSLTISAPDLVPQSLAILEPANQCENFSAESPHPYPDAFVFAVQRVCPAAEAIRIHFDPRTDIGPDVMEIMQADGSPVEGSPFTGAELADTTINILGDTVRIHFASRHGYSGWGFAVTEARELRSTQNTVVAVQQPLFFRWVVQNDGAAPTLLQSMDSIALVADRPTASWQDVTQMRATELSPGDSYVQRVTALLPSVKPGQYSLVVVADSASEVDESSETNNAFAIPVEVASPDLTVINLQAPPVVNGQSDVEVVWTVRNNGPVEAFPPWEDWLYVSPTNRLTPQAQPVLYNSLFVSLRPSNTYSVTQSFTLPPIAFSNCFLIAKTDASIRLFDSFADDNEFARPLTVKNPDLVATNFEILGTAPLIFPPQAELDVSYRVVNRGPGRVMTHWWDQIFFSTDRVVDEDDIPLGMDLYGSNTLAVADTYERRATIRLPGEDPGEYFLLFKANAYTNVAEVNHANNTLAIPIRLALVDLELASADATNAAAPYQRIPVSWTVRNASTVNAISPWVDTVYLSKTPLLGPGAAPVAALDRTENCIPGATYSASINVPIPNIAAGAYYLIVAADSQNSLAEANRTNNLMILPLTIMLPDLRVADFSGESTNLLASPQTGLSLHWRVENLGTGVAARYWSDGFYLSLDTDLDPADILLGSVSAYDDLPPQSEYVRESTITVAGVPPGQYYLFLKVDAGNARPETTETNNIAMIPVTIGESVDLRPLYLNAPASLEMSNRSVAISLAWSVTNQGAATTPLTWYDSVYLSRDARYDPSDWQLTSALHLEPVSPGGTYDVLQTVTVQIEQSGLYYLLLWVDGPGLCPEGCLYETNKTNNIIAVPLQVTLNLPDLVVRDVRAPPLLVSSADYVPAELTWVVQNQGSGTAAGPWVDGVYVNGQYQHSMLRNISLVAGASYTNGALVYLAYPSDGTYTVTIRADDSPPFNDVLETVETNNSLSASFQFVRSPKEFPLAGESGSVPLLLGTPSAASAIEFDLFAPTGKVTNVSASANQAQLSLLTMLPTGAGRYHLRFEMLPNISLVGTQEFARIQFQAVAGQSSAFVSFNASNLTVRTAQGALVSGAFVHPGRAVIIGPELLLEAIAVAPSQHALTLYGLPNSNVILQSKTSFNSQLWTNTWQGSFTNRFQSLGPYPNPNSSRVYRARY